MSSPIGATPDPDWDHEGRERAGPEQKQLLTTRVSQLTFKSSQIQPWTPESFWLLIIFMSSPDGLSWAALQISGIQCRLPQWWTVTRTIMAALSCSDGLRKDGWQRSGTNHPRWAPSSSAGGLFVVHMQHLSKNWDQLHVQYRIIACDLDWIQCRQ